MQHEREGGHIDRDLLNNVLSVFVEIGINTMECYEDDIEMHLLKNTEDYYFVKAQTWIHGTACSDYLIKVPFKTSMFAYIYMHSLLRLTFLYLDEAKSVFQP